LSGLFPSISSSVSERQHRCLKTAGIIRPRLDGPGHDAGKLYLSGAIMFEIIIFCVILFAVGYWATLFVMGRREDVLHGEFVEAGTEPELASPDAPPPAVPDFVVRHASAPAEASRPESAPVPAPPGPVLADLPPANPEALQSLLVSLKQELKNASQI
jgi:hypothetical protein